MEKRIEGEVTDRRTNGRDISFTVKAGNNSYKLSNCRLCNTDQQVYEKGIECYSGNIDIIDDGVTKTVSSTLWVKPENKCICIYQQ